MASSERVFRLLDTEPELTDPAQPGSPLVRGAIAFEDVSFAYDGATGCSVTLTCASGGRERSRSWARPGAGKTSIVSLLARFYDAQRGRIPLDGVDVRDLRQPDLRRHVASSSKTHSSFPERSRRTFGSGTNRSATSGSARRRAS